MGATVARAVSAAERWAVGRRTIAVTKLMPKRTWRDYSLIALSVWCSYAAFIVFRAAPGLSGPNDEVARRVSALLAVIVLSAFLSSFAFWLRVDRPIVSALAVLLFQFGASGVAAVAAWGSGSLPVEASRLAVGVAGITLFLFTLKSSGRRGSRRASE